MDLIRVKLSQVVLLDHENLLALFINIDLKIVSLVAIDSLLA